MFRESRETLILTTEEKDLIFLETNEKIEKESQMILNTVKNPTYREKMDLEEEDLLEEDEEPDSTKDQEERMMGRI